MAVGNRGQSHLAGFSEYLACRCGRCHVDANFSVGGGLPLLLSLFAGRLCEPLLAAPQKAGLHHPPSLSMGWGSGPYAEGWSLMNEFPKGLSMMPGAQLD